MIVFLREQYSDDIGIEAILGPHVWFLSRIKGLVLSQKVDLWGRGVAPQDVLACKVKSQQMKAGVSSLVFSPADFLRWIPRCVHAYRLFADIPGRSAAH